MKKIFTILLVFILTLSSSFATTWIKTTMNSDDLIGAKIFYINWEWYVKENGMLKKVDNPKFYNIWWKRYIKRSWEVHRLQETKIYKINGISYVKDNGKLMTLDKFLEENEVSDKKEKWTFSDIHKDTLEKAEEEEINDSVDETIEDMFKSIFSDDFWTGEEETNNNEEINDNSNSRDDSQDEVLEDENEIESEDENVNEEEEFDEEDIFNEIFSGL